MDEERDVLQYLSEDPEKQAALEAEGLIRRFAEVKDHLEADVKKNIGKERGRQKKSFDVRNTGKGGELEKGQSLMFRNSLIFITNNSSAGSLVYFKDTKNGQKLSSKEKRSQLGPSEVLEMGKNWAKKIATCVKNRESEQEAYSNSKTSAHAEERTFPHVEKNLGLPHQIRSRRAAIRVNRRNGSSNLS